MPLGITAEHEELHRVARRWLGQHSPLAVPRALLDAPAEPHPEFWDALGDLGWLGLHVAEEHGGAGFGLPELAVVLEEMGRACTPGPFTASALAAAVVASCPPPLPPELALVLGDLASGARVGAVAWHGALEATRAGDGIVVSGTLRPVLSGALADVLVVPAVTADGEERWCAVDATAFEVRELPSIDRARRVAHVVASAVSVAPGRVLPGVTRARVDALATAMLAAEAVGVAQWCVEAAAEYAAVRVQFDRPIGQFQGVKHRCADMLARTELARAAAWDAARAVDDTANGGELAVAAAAVLAAEAATSNAKDCIQTLGGIGFTWEHDAHLYLRRALTLHALAGDIAAHRVRAARLAIAGTRRRLAVDLGDAAESARGEVRDFLAGLAGLDEAARRARLAECGYLTPAWPRPWGRDASATEMLVIDEEFRAAKVVRPSIAVAGWALPTLIVYGAAEQQQRWITPTLRGELSWCQLFSEPGAGSDLAGLSTRAERVAGGWVVNGQKVWSTLAHQADWGILLARTAPDRPKHEGISCFMLDMKSPGITVRPLREITGASLFNEVFLDDVFMPDDCLVGAEHDGWRCARTTLANERVSMGSGNTLGGGVAGLLRALTVSGREDDPAALSDVGDLVVTGHALAVLGYRLTLSALRGADPSGSEAAVRKLLGVLNDQRIQEVGLDLLGAEAATEEGDGAAWNASFLFNRCLTIAGGTTDIQKNVIGERLLGLPRDP